MKVIRLTEKQLREAEAGIFPCTTDSPVRQPHGDISVTGMLDTEESGSNDEMGIPIYSDYVADELTAQGYGRYWHGFGDYYGGLHHIIDDFASNMNDTNGVGVRYDYTTYDDGDDIDDPDHYGIDLDSLRDFDFSSGYGINYESKIKKKRIIEQNDNNPAYKPMTNGSDEKNTISNYPESPGETPNKNSTNTFYNDLNNGFSDPDILATDKKDCSINKSVQKRLYDLVQTINYLGLNELQQSYVLDLFYSRFYKLPNSYLRRLRKNMPQEFWHKFNLLVNEIKRAHLNGHKIYQIINEMFKRFKTSHVPLCLKKMVRQPVIGNGDKSVTRGDKKSIPW